MRSLTLATNTLALKDKSLPNVEWYDLRRILREAVFDWDKVVKSTHPVNCWYNMHCPVNVYTKDGVVLREEQPHNYPEPNDPDCPDFNPKGCAMGCAAAHRLYDPSRLLYPLKRVGARGQGKWTRVSWNEALDDIAATMLDVMVTDGPYAITDAGATTGGFLPMRLSKPFLGLASPELNAEIGDEHQGAWEFTGKMMFTNSADDIFYSDLVLLWGGNPAYTAPTVYHYITEARYHGAKVIAISVDYNASALPADVWITVKPGSDGALALSMAQVILEEGLHKEEFLAEQTDMPLLVRTDNRKFLREQDVTKDGRDYVYHFWDAASNSLAAVNLQTLELDGKRPALEGEWEVETLDGRVRVRPVFALFKEKLDSEYRPEQASEMCGVSPRLIRELAREFAGAKGVVNFSQANFGKYYHGNLMERACIYLWALCGHMGRRGANYSAFVGVWLPDMKVGSLLPFHFNELPALMAFHPKYREWKEKGFSDERIALEGLWEQGVPAGRASFTSLLHYFHSGLIELSKKYNSWDPHLKRPLEEYLREGLESRKKPALPGPERDPKVFFNWGGNVIRRIRGNQHVIENLLPKLRLMVTVDWRWSASATYADYVLPVACPWYEAQYTLGTAFSPGYSLWLTHAGKAVEPPGESKHDWWVWVNLCTRIAQKARDRGVTTVTEPEYGVEARVDSLDQLVTSGGLYGGEDDDIDRLTRDAFSSATNLDIKDTGWQGFAEKGYSEFTEVSGFPWSLENAGDLTRGEPFVPNTWHVVKKQPWPTATGRLQFYIDHDWYLELGEEFAWHKDSIKSGGDYPLQLTSGHARWSIHGLWADSPLLLQLQRGEPVMFMSPLDAGARGIEDGDSVEASNDVGSFDIQVVVSPAVRPGQLIVYHSWENYQFRGWRQFQQVMPTPFNPVEFAPAGSDYPNVRADQRTGHPGHNDRDTRVEVRKL